MGKEPSKEAKRGGRDCAEGSNNMGWCRSCPRLLGEPNAESMRRVPNGIIYKKYVIAIQTPLRRTPGQKPDALRRCLKAAPSAHRQRALHQSSERGWGLGFDPWWLLLPQLQGEGGNK